GDDRKVGWYLRRRFNAAIGSQICLEIRWALPGSTLKYPKRRPQNARPGDRRHGITRSTSRFNALGVQAIPSPVQGLRDGACCESRMFPSTLHCPRTAASAVAKGVLLPQSPYWRGPLPQSTLLAGGVPSAEDLGFVVFGKARLSRHDGHRSA